MRACRFSSLIAALGAAWIVIDGDTVRSTSGETYRLRNFDAAEIFHAQCEAERRLGLLTRTRLEALIAGGEADHTVEMRSATPPQRDRYGRVLGHLVVDGEDAGCLLIKEGYARPWRGRREAWCDGKDDAQIDTAALDCGTGQPPTSPPRQRERHE